jgi:hypothetical protein
MAKLKKEWKKEGKNGVVAMMQKANVSHGKDGKDAQERVPLHLSFRVVV